VFSDLSIWHILILVLIITLLFGTKRIPEIGASIGKGIQEFKRGLRDTSNDSAVNPPPAAPTNVGQPPADQRLLPPTGAAPKRLNQ
jgi:sec-independent protein translocase protein TatA